MDALQVERRTSLALLLDFYGALLTARQRDVLSRHLEQDLSYGEIAAELGITRQAVHDLVKRGAEALQDYERRLGLLARFERQRRALQEVRRLLRELDL
jgi:predicted DNA-binding protein YlxM (UPF0122 family)